MTPAANFGLHSRERWFRGVVVVERHFGIVEAVADEEAHLCGSVAGRNVLAVTATRSGAVDLSRKAVSYS